MTEDVDTFESSVVKCIMPSSLLIVALFTVYMAGENPIATKKLYTELQKKPNSLSFVLVSL